MTTAISQKLISVTLSTFANENVLGQSGGCGIKNTIFPAQRKQARGIIAVGNCGFRRRFLWGPVGILELCTELNF